MSLLLSFRLLLIFSCVREFQYVWLNTYQLFFSMLLLFMSFSVYELQAPDWMNEKYIWENNLCHKWHETRLYQLLMPLPYRVSHSSYLLTLLTAFCYTYDTRNIRISLFFLKYTWVFSLSLSLFSSPSKEFVIRIISRNRAQESGNDFIHVPFFDFLPQHLLFG